jgi:hypothetical protein
MENQRVMIAMTDEAKQLLAPLLDLFLTSHWSQEREDPICLVCERVDFSGHLVEALVLDPTGTASSRVWLRHEYVMAAFDFSEKMPVGFHAH